MVKSLLLGSAAGLVAVVGAQAADLPVKAKPVEYVKVCALYGVGFYYIPGTDTCIKIGGFLRAEWNWDAGGSFAPGAVITGAGGVNDRTYNQLVSRARGIVSFDVRTQTEYGTLRSYLRAGWQWSTGDDIGMGSGVRGGSPGTYIDRAFIQFAGFTFGRTQSFFDFFIFPQYSNQTNVLTGDTGGTGTNLIAYTAQFGNGLTASISLEENWMRRRGVIDYDENFLGSLTVAPIDDDAGQTIPDIVANLRVDQAWGSAQIMGALHYLNARYLGADLNTNPKGGDEWGWAVGAGVTVNLPWAKGDTASIQGNWCSGATGYCFAGSPGIGANFSGTVGVTRYGSNTSAAIGVVIDAIYGTNLTTGVVTGLETVDSWSFYAGIEHYWTPALRTSLYGGYGKVDYSSGSTALICSGAPAVAAVNVLTNANITNCDPSFSLWQIGSRTVWNPVRNLDLSVDVLWTQLNTAFQGPATFFANAPRPASAVGGAVFDDEGVLSAMFRVQRNFWP
jgi:hypothetical protein